MKNILILPLLLAACAAPPGAPVLTPVSVDMPLIIPCKPPVINAPPDLMAALPPQPTLAQFTQSCAAQNLYDRAYTLKLQAALRACE